MLLFSHLVDTLNRGDLASGPYLWFDFPKHTIADARSAIPEYAAAIFGGGAITGLLPSIYRIGRKNIAWGVGSSIHGRTHATRWPSFFDLVGVRDYDDPTVYVPCSSCMSPLFDDHDDPIHPAVLFLNADPSITGRYPVLVSDLPTMDNRQPLHRILRFLRSGEIVISNSYHGCYWATLLGRPVVAVAYSSKFYGLKFQPALSYDGSDWYHLRPRRYTEALEDSRHINRSFYHSVLAVLESASIY